MKEIKAYVHRSRIADVIAGRHGGRTSGREPRGATPGRPISRSQSRETKLRGPSLNTQLPHASDPMTSDHPNPLDLRAQPHLEPDAQAHPQAHPDACFDASWLALRRAADSAARAPELEARAADWLRQRRTAAAPGQPLRLIDLGSGSGANPCPVPSSGR